MALTNAQQRVFGLSREDLPKASFSDERLLEILMETLIVKLEAEGGVGQVDRELIQAFQDRYNWLSALADVNGFGSEPMLFANGGTTINTDWIKYWARRRGIDITQAALEGVTHAERSIEHMRENLERLKQIAATERYEPAEGEPSIFGGDRTSPGTDWMLWYSSTQATSLIAAHEAGKAIIDQLANELPRFMGGDMREPEVSVFSKELEKAGVKHRALSFKWVIFAKYARGLDWHEAHADGLILQRRIV